jgi:hypothetical protein
MKSKMAKFATCDLDNRTGVDDCHWIPQSMYTSECDSVLRYESLRSMSTLIGNGSPRSFDDSKGLLTRGSLRTRSSSLTQSTSRSPLRC